MDLAPLRLLSLLVPVAILCFRPFTFADPQVNYDPAQTKHPFVKHATRAPLVSYYDYIIVGGGTAGCPLAATLSANSDVLVLERGGSPYGNRNISELASLVDNLADVISPTSPVQRFVSEDGVVNARARVLGGGTCINAGFYSRASAQEVREMGWDSQLVQESYQWVEKVVAFEPRLVEWTAAMKEALVEVGVTPDNGFTYEHLNGTKIGGSTFDPTSHRHTAADLLEYANPSRLTVLLRATAQRILFKKEKQTPRAYGVEYKDETGQTHYAYLKNLCTGEVLVSAGAIGSPQLLMLSGIGPADHLRSLGIEVVVDHRMVGQGMSDNPLSTVIIPSPVPVEIASVQVVGILEKYLYVESISGLSIGPAVGIATTPTSANQMAIVDNGNTTESSSSFQGGMLGFKLARPLSQGYLKLKNLNIEDNPAVTFNYMVKPEDVQTCIQGMRLMKRVIESRKLDKFHDPNLTFDDLLSIVGVLDLNKRQRQNNYDSTNLDHFCKDLVLSIWHFHGGCQVGKVVDHDYKVIGADGLRVIDGSTFIFSPGTNPQATVMMLGRYMGLKIQKKQGGGRARDENITISSSYEFKF